VHGARTCRWVVGNTRRDNVSHKSRNFISSRPRISLACIYTCCRSKSCRNVTKRGHINANVMAELTLQRVPPIPCVKQRDIKVKSCLDENVNEIANCVDTGPPTLPSTPALSYGYISTRFSQCTAAVGQTNAKELGHNYDSTSIRYPGSTPVRFQ